MACYVKEHEWDEAIGKGQVLVGSDSGPDLWIDVEHNVTLPDEAWIMRCMWSRLYTETEDEEKHRIQYSYSGRDEYYECALDFIDKLLKAETMNCFVKDHRWDEDELKGSVLVGSDTGPELWVDVSAVQNEEGYTWGAAWNTVESEFQLSYDNYDAYVCCAVDFIEKEYM